MSSKVDEPRNSKTSSTVSTIGPKISMFAAKSGFVIPKNKLSGSLVPVLRGVKKSGGSDAANDESTNQVQRKTKWGPDLTHDAAVRRGRALAYQVIDTNFIVYHYLVHIKFESKSWLLGMPR